MGIAFRCPHCATRLGIWFVNPIDAGPPIEAIYYQGRLLARAGDTFDTITLAPTINAAKHWKGFIHRGSVIDLP